jgi:hypothetical protein
MYPYANHNTILAAFTTVFAQVGVSNVLPISPESLCGVGGEKTEETRARCEHSDGRVFCPPASITIKQ